MKVLYFTRGQSPHDLRFTQALAQTQHQVFVLCLVSAGQRTWPQGITEIKWHGLAVDKGWGQTLRLVKNLRKVISDLKPDLIHAGPIPRVAFLVALAGYHPLVTMSWGFDLMREVDMNRWWRWVTKYTLKHSDFLVADCESSIKKAIQLGFPPDRYKIFPWGVDLEHFNPSGSALLREKLGWENKTVLLSNRSLEPVYGVDVAVDAFIKACQSDPNLRLLLFGKGALEETLRVRIKMAGLSDKVHLGGFASTADLPDVYRSADLFLSASHTDGSSVSLMEALACGLPVIVSDIPANLEWVRENEQGWIFRDGSVNEMIEKIQKAVSCSQQWSEKKFANRRLAEARADWNKNFPVLLDAYQLAVQSCNTTRKAV